MLLVYFPFLSGVLVLFTEALSDTSLGPTIGQSLMPLAINAHANPQAPMQSYNLN